MNEESSWIEVELFYLAEHQWKEAPKKREYLKPLHQHLFKIVVRMSVTHLDRDVEFHDLRQVVWKYLNGKISLNDSCEGNAKNLFKYLRTGYPNHKISVVFEEEGGVKGKYGHQVI